MNDHVADLEPLMSRKLPCFKEDPKLGSAHPSPASKDEQQCVERKSFARAVVLLHEAPALENNVQIRIREGFGNCPKRDRTSVNERGNLNNNTSTGPRNDNLIIHLATMLSKEP